MAPSGTDHRPYLDRDPNIVVERLAVRNSDAQAVWDRCDNPTAGGTFPTVSDAITDALRRSEETGLVHRVEHDNETVWSSDGLMP